MSTRPVRSSWTLPPVTESAATARTVVAEVASGSTKVDDAVLAVSELVTNAVRYGQGLVRLDVVRTGAMLRVRVESISTDSNPTLTTAAPGDTGGRGLAIVAALSTRWSWQRDGDRVAVWAEFDES
jgi:anti-sigma regulatory factor (Ser/Thr protein kinase)